MKLDKDFAIFALTVVLVGGAVSIAKKGKEQRDRFDGLLAQVRDQTAAVLCSNMTMSQNGWSNPPVENGTTVLKSGDSQTYQLNAVLNKGAGNSVSVTSITAGNAEKICEGLAISPPSHPPPVSPSDSPRR